MITLKKIKFGAERLHQETLNFAADVYFNNMLIAYAYNQGHGGSTSVMWSSSDEKTKSMYSEAEKWCLAQPKIDGEITANLENIVDEIVYKEYEKRAVEKQEKQYQAKLKKLSKKYLVLIDLDRNDASLSFKMITPEFMKNKSVDDVFEKIKDKLPKNFQFITEEFQKFNKSHA